MNKTGNKASSLLNLLLITLLAPFWLLSQNTDNSKLCKKLAIAAAQWGKQSYSFSKEVYLGKAPIRNIDSAQYCIQQAIGSLDSCISLAADSAFLAKSFAAMAKKSAQRTVLTIKLFNQEKSNSLKREYAWRTVSYASQCVLDAYHASFYFEGDTTAEKKTEEPPAAPPVDKKITKLDIDQALFALLDEQLIEKEEKEKKEIAKLEAQIKTTKDPAKLAKLKSELKKLEKEEAALELKDKEAKEKLTKINAELSEREKLKNNTAAAETNAFSKSLNRPADDWNKTVLTEAELPAGLVYQVQIGVYKNPVTAETFKGITPIFGRTTSIGITYSAGIFEKLNDAKQAKEYVLSMGLHDAFVIAYHDKKRITIAEAAKLEKK